MGSVLPSCVGSIASRVNPKTILMLLD